MKLKKIRNTTIASPTLKSQSCISLLHVIIPIRRILIPAIIHTHPAVKSKTCLLTLNPIFPCFEFTKILFLSRLNLYIRSFFSASSSLISLLRKTDKIVRNTTIPPKTANSSKLGSNTVFKISDAINISSPNNK